MTSASNVIVGASRCCAAAYPTAVRTGQSEGDSMAGDAVDVPVGLELVRFISEPKTDTQAVVFANADRTHWDIAFRGTTSRKDWRTNARARLGLGGWSRAIDSIGPVLWEVMNDIPNNAETEVVVSGHSLGGSLALYSVLMGAVTQQRRTLSIVTFGAPRTLGAKQLEELQERFHGHFIRVANLLDAVTWIPYFGDWVHAGELMPIAPAKPSRSLRPSRQVKVQHAMQHYLERVECLPNSLPNSATK